MALLEWSDALSLDMPVMDETHQEFIELLAVVEVAADEALLPAWDVLIAHTDEHFSREDEWMRRAGFAAGNCHSVQHRVVLETMREGARLAANGRLYIVREMARQLAPWFVNHAQSMDAGLALHLRSLGFDPRTGQFEQLGGGAQMRLESGHLTMEAHERSRPARVGHPGASTPSR